MTHYHTFSGQCAKMSCEHNHVPGVCQTLDEMDFERGIWHAGNI